MAKFVTFLVLLLATSAFAAMAPSGGDQTSKQADVAKSAFDKFVPIMGFRNDAAISLSSGDLRYTPLTVDSTGRLRTDATISEVATAANGAAAPALGKMAEGIDGGGLARFLLTDASGQLQGVITSSALPTGAATAAKQDTGNTSLSSIDGKLNSLGQKAMVGSVPVAIASDQSAIPASQSGTWNINNISGTVSLPTGAATSANQTTANTSLSSIDGKLTTTVNGLKVDVQASALPTGAATSALQTTGNTSLSSIDGKLGSLGQKAMVGSAPVVIASDQSAIPASQSGTWNINNISGTVSLPTGAATSANQTTANTSLSSIDGKLGSLGQKAMAGSAPVVLASDQSAVPTKAPVNANGSQTTGTVSTVITLTAPANAVGFILQAADTNTANMRYRIGAVATSASGQQLQPGRDSGYVPGAANISIVAESGTQEYEVQWILSQ